MAHRITKHLSPTEFPYAVGQGALGIEIREDDSETLKIIQPIEDPLTRWICIAERSMLRTLQGGCSSPVAVNCTVESGNRLRLEGNIIHPLSSKQITKSAVADVTCDSEATALGAVVAKSLEEGGGRALLDEIRSLQEKEMNVA